MRSGVRYDKGWLKLGYRFHKVLGEDMNSEEFRESISFVEQEKQSPRWGKLKRGRGGKKKWVVQAALVGGEGDRIKILDNVEEQMGLVERILAVVENSREEESA